MFIRFLSLLILLIISCSSENPCTGKQQTGCDDVITSCELVFPAGDPNTANDKCFDPTDGNFPLTPMCRKTCRLCCQEDRFNCDNDPIPNIGCPESQAECNQFSDINFLHCKSACGWCDRTSKPCVDSLDSASCRTFKDATGNLCSNPEVSTQCEKTCGVCVPADCEDTSKRCPIWFANGFCQDTFYTDDDKKSYCMKSCELCPAD